MDMTRAAAAGPTMIFVGTDYTLFEKARTASVELDREIQMVGTKQQVSKLLETGNISLVIVDLALKGESARQLLNEIRKERPSINLMAVTSYRYRGHSIHDILAYNYHCIAKNIDGTITVEQFRQAIKKVDSNNSASRRRAVITFFCMIAIMVLAWASGSPIGIFLGVFWITVLLVEAAYCAIPIPFRKNSNESRNPKIN
jgi:ActR/RegA family two-component response regulator